MEKRLNIRLNANRTVRGVLRGYDEFMNLVLDNTEEVVSGDEVNELGMVVIRGNSIVEIESLDKLTS
jgi:small nuclear ribonucleoprotein G